MEPELKCEECGQPITVLRCWQACRTEKRGADDLLGSPAADKRRKLSSEELALALWRTGMAESLMDAICSDALTELARRGMIIQGLNRRSCCVVMRRQPDRGWAVVARTTFWRIRELR